MPNRKSVVLLLALLVLLPLGALGVLGSELVGDQEALVEHQVGELLTERLRDTAGSIGRFLEERQRKLREAAAGLPRNADEIRAYLRERRLSNALVLSREGKVLFPPTGKEPSSQFERAFIERTRKAWEDKSLLSLAARADSPEGPDRGDGWFAWYQGGGLNLLLWLLESDRIVALELERVRLISDLVAWLPDTELAADESTSRTALLDANENTLYQWGSYTPAKAEPARAELPLSPPLGTWKLQLFSSADGLPAIGGGLGFNLAAGGLAVTFVLLALAVWLYRARQREIRLATQRMSFVNQVSHELKTPLTNIRLYAELLEESLGEDEEADPASQRQLNVIVAESQRLSRLITNVLTFARGQERRLVVRPAPCILDEVVDRTLQAFGPTFERLEVEVERRGEASQLVNADRDAVEQIMANLLSNVEKYGATGGVVEVETAWVDGIATIVVADHGPGVPTDQAERIFEPFQRLSNKLTDSVTGTGIGLDIARSLARLHGGGLRLERSEVGARFRVTLNAPTVG